MSRHDRCLSPRCDCMDGCAVADATLEEREACAVDLEGYADAMKAVSDPLVHQTLKLAANFLRTRE